MNKSLLLGLGALVLISGIGYVLFSNSNAQSFDDTSAFSCASLGADWEMVSSPDLSFTFCQDSAWGVYSVRSAEESGAKYVTFAQSDVRVSVYRQDATSSDAALAVLREVDLSQDDMTLRKFFASDEQELVQKNVFNGITMLQGIVRAPGAPNFRVDFYVPSVPMAEGTEDLFLTASTANEVGLINILTSLRPRE